LPLARGTGAAIKLDSFVILFTVTRNFLSWIRGSWLGYYIPVDKNIVFHRYIAWTIAINSWVHFNAWYWNYLQYSAITNANVAMLNLFALDRQYSAFELAFTTLAGSTGYVVSIVQILIYSSSLKFVRGTMFNVFWFTHHLFILYFPIMIVHGALGLYEGYPPYWAFVVLPGLVYIVERTIRVLRGNQDTILQLAVAHPSRVLELQLKKNSFTYKPGQYLYLNCPFIAKYEWHPFTISSSPEEDFVSVHVRIVGDWTDELWKLLNPSRRLGVIQEDLLTSPDGGPIFKIDGPYGAASEHVFDFKTVILIAGGIGVTPFGSILKHIRYRMAMGSQGGLEKVYFVWVCRDKTSFEWFNEILAALEQDNPSNFLEIETYLTGRLSTHEIKNIMYGDTPSDAITGLQSPTHFGRPKWEEFFNDKRVKHSGKRVGVFFCGPPALSKEVRKICGKNSSSGAKFIFYKENF